MLSSIILVLMSTSGVAISWRARVGLINLSSPEVATTIFSPTEIYLSICHFLAV